MRDFFQFVEITARKDIARGARVDAIKSVDTAKLPGLLYRTRNYRSRVRSSIFFFCSTPFSSLVYDATFELFFVLSLSPNVGRTTINVTGGEKGLRDS